MSQTTPNTVLRRMIGSQSVAGEGDWPGRLLARAFEKSSFDLLGLAVEVTAIEQSVCSPGDISSLMTDHAMFAILEGAETGAFAVDIPLLSGFVEHQTVGAIARQVAEGRVPSRVDAALISPVLDQTLETFDATIDEGIPQSWANGYVFGAMVPDARAVQLVLSCDRLHLFSLRVSLGGGVRDGKLAFLFADLPPALQEDDAGPEHFSHSDTFRKGVLMSPATFSAVIAKLNLPLGALQALKPGDMLDLPAGAVAGARLEAANSDIGVPVELGQLNGCRAVRLQSPDASPSKTDGPALLPETVVQAPPKPVPAIKEPEPAAAAEDGAVENLEDLDDLWEAGDLPEIEPA